MSVVHRLQVTSHNLFYSYPYAFCVLTLQHAWFLVVCKVHLHLLVYLDKVVTCNLYKVITLPFLIRASWHQSNICWFLERARPSKMCNRDRTSQPTFLVSLFTEREWHLRKIWFWIFAGVLHWPIGEVSFTSACALCMHTSLSVRTRFQNIEMSLSLLNPLN